MTGDYGDRSAVQEKNYQWEYYVNQLHEMDNFIKDLTDACRNTMKEWCW